MIFIIPYFARIYKGYTDIRTADGMLKRSIIKSIRNNKGAGDPSPATILVIQPPRYRS